MRNRFFLIAIVSMLVLPFQLLGYCYMPGDPTEPAPEWVCYNFEKIDGYSEVAVSSYSLLFSGDEPEDYYFLLALANANEELLRMRKKRLGEKFEDSMTKSMEGSDGIDPYNSETSRSIIDESINSKIIEDFYTPTAVYILVAATPDGDRYELQSLNQRSEASYEGSIDYEISRTLRMTLPDGKKICFYYSFTSSTEPNNPEPEESYEKITQCPDEREK